ncbi:antibiotic biosynthesis monooxygenase [Massilia eurypsychrophila]|jgi:heme-degrading monooxygenase HmoA|uniref:Antibiotic biosynthesis monooxygenase n=1 Tax=Massilia eurypsychrophila TaxID=1485217 RepID=A0A2G8T9J1_9BURK|nr:antibiotic biosynthesis monooxygenase family protein [Massilia eurypsychrophila]PIL42682.1 antibiotic biosynthesis monooxygenase [Massilia eurypsychrophila]
MITEIAEIAVKAGTDQQFEAAVAMAAPLFERARGCRSMRLERGIEQPDTYLLIVEWETLENHEVDFRQSADFQEWRHLVGDFFASPPKVIHTRKALTGF